jgi:hypothetical protein
MGSLVARPHPERSRVDVGDLVDRPGRVLLVQNHRQVIPAETKERIALPREEFLHALRRAEIMATSRRAQPTTGSWR